MENKELYHHGILGMKWGIRRFQNKDGSLTAAGKKRLKAKDDPEPETPEQRHARVIKSTDPMELYKNRDVLSTAEINERLSRIDAERRLKEVSDKSKKTAMDHIDSALKVGRKMNEIYEFTQKPMMKAVGKSLNKKLGIADTADEVTDVVSALKNIKSLSDKDLQKVINRGNNEKTLRNLVDELNGKSKDEKTNVSDLIKDVDNLSDKDLQSLLKRSASEKAAKKLVEDINREAETERKKKEEEDN